MSASKLERELRELLNARPKNGAPKKAGLYAVEDLLGDVGVALVDDLGFRGHYLVFVEGRALAFSPGVDVCRHAPLPLPRRRRASQTTEPKR